MLHAERLVGLVVKVSASTAGDPGFDTRWRREDVSGSSHTMTHYWHSCGYSARHLTFLGQRWDWLARCQHTMG